ncbi:MAG TPA: protein kinase [Blastocatellia bacterium]|nr:protein kinase [Blastocatellia bacterium]
MSSRRIGNYQITDYIGGGGFGSVFKAEDTSTPGRVVAVKELHKKHTRNPIVKQRFFQEAVAMARLDHPNLPRLFTFGEDNGCYYLVMEFISGRTLSDEIHDKGAIGPEMAVRIIAQALEALSYAHRNGIIHRDLKPDNIILMDDDSLKVKVLDFGIARMVGGENITLAGEGFGTPAYMSPERITGTSGDDPRIDIYSAGIILFEMLAGKTPYESSASDPVIYWSEMRQLHESHPLPSLASLGVPPELERIAVRATAKRAEDRYASADEMLGELRSVMGESAAPAGQTAGAHTARLALTTQPGGAEVYVDDLLRGSSDPARGKILIEELPPGLRSVRVTKAGYGEYRINVALEEDRQTDLQVALAARATLAMPVAEATAAAGFGTSKLEGEDETQTAVLVVESLPAGSTVYLGANAVAQAGEDGRATIKLAPGAHEVKVAAPSGRVATKTVMVTAADGGSLKKMTIPIEEAAKTDPMPVAVAGSPSVAKKRIAVSASIALLLALAAAAYFVFRSPARENTPINTVTTQQSAVTPPAAPSEPASSPNGVGSDQKASADEQQKAQSDAEKAKQDKKLAEAEKKANEEKKAAENKSAAPEPSSPAPAVAPPAVPAPPTQADTQPPATGGDTCVLVNVTAPEGVPLGRLRVTVTEQGGAAYDGQINQRGRGRICGLTVGRKVTVELFGPRGRQLASKQSVISARNNFVEFSAADKTPDEVPPYERPRKPFRRQRP